ncbi:MULTISPECIES: small membrane protein [Klebsiella]|nr:MULTISPECIES: small membrane protein [Klebsiella]
MSTIFLMTIAILLLGISVYSLLSYIKERRAKRFRPFRQR